MASGGARVGAGRKAHLEDKTIQTILRLSAYNIIRYFRSPDFTVKEKAELGKHFVLKKIPTVVESDGSFAPKTIVLMRNDKAIEENTEKLSMKDLPHREEAVEPV